MALPDTAEPYWRRQQSIIATAVATALRAWQGSGGTTQWESIVPFIESTVMRAQAFAASNSGDYVQDTLHSLGVDVEPIAVINPEPLIGVSGNGVSLSGLYSRLPVQMELHTARIAALTKEPAETVFRAALTATGKQLAASVQTIISDTGRAAESLHIVARPHIGYVRMVNKPACSRCIVQAGKYFKWNAGFKRHPNCFPAGTVVSGPKLDAATRRWFEGELVILSTASGEKLSVTGNHPILTRRGWIPANLLKEGDEVVRSTRSKGAAALVIPDHDQVPARIEDVWSSFAVGGLNAVESSPEDFHGDGQDGKVDVVYADGSLRDWRNSTFREHSGQPILADGLMSPVGFDTQGSTSLLDEWSSALVGCSMSGGGLGFSLDGGHLVGADLASFASAPYVDVGAHQTLSDDFAGYSVLPAQGILAGSSHVCGHDVGIGELDFSRWDALASPMFVEGSPGYADRGKDLFDRLAGQVELDRIVVLSRISWSGHVYSLTSSEGWHTANNLIVSNCDCRHIPVPESLSGDLRVNTGKYFQSLSQDQQDAAFGKAGAQAIRDGADLSQVVNADAGMRAAQVYGKNLRITDSGVTKRGFAGQVIKARGRNAATTPRLMPSSIYQIAEDRQDAIRLLRLNGYILPDGESTHSISDLLNIAS